MNYLNVLIILIFYNTLKLYKKNKNKQASALLSRGILIYVHAILTAFMGA